MLSFSIAHYAFSVQKYCFYLECPKFSGKKVQKSKKVEQKFAQLRK